MAKSDKTEKNIYEFVSKDTAKVGDVIEFHENGKSYPAKVFDKQKGKKGTILHLKVIGIGGDNIRRVAL